MFFPQYPPSLDKSCLHSPHLQDAKAVSTNRRSSPSWRAQSPFYTRSKMKKHLWTPCMLAPLQPWWRQFLQMTVVILGKAPAVVSTEELDETVSMDPATAPDVSTDHWDHLGARPKVLLRPISTLGEWISAGRGRHGGKLLDRPHLPGARKLSTSNMFSSLEEQDYYLPHPPWTWSLPVPPRSCYSPSRSCPVLPFLPLCGLNDAPQQKYTLPPAPKTKTTPRLSPCRSCFSPLTI